MGTRDREGRHRRQLPTVCALGPAFVLAGSREGLHRMVALRAGAVAAGKPAQRTAKMEAINTDRPGTRFQATGPRWDK